jgi:hypothetical protein
MHSFFLASIIHPPPVLTLVGTAALCSALQRARDSCQVVLCRAKSVASACCGGFICYYPTTWPCQPPAPILLGARLNKTPLPAGPPLPPFQSACMHTCKRRLGVLAPCKGLGAARRPACFACCALAVRPCCALASCLCTCTGWVASSPECQGDAALPCLLRSGLV